MGLDVLNDKANLPRKVGYVAREVNLFHRMVMLSANFYVSKKQPPYCNYIFCIVL